MTDEDSVGIKVVKAIGWAALACVSALTVLWLQQCSATCDAWNERIIECEDAACRDVLLAEPPEHCSMRYVTPYGPSMPAWRARRFIEHGSRADGEP